MNTRSVDANAGSSAGLDELLNELDADSMAADGNRTGRPSKASIAAGVQHGSKVRRRAERSSRQALARFRFGKPALTELVPTISNYIVVPSEFRLDAALGHRFRRLVAHEVSQTVVTAITDGQDPRIALTAGFLHTAFARANASTGRRLSDAATATAARAAAELIGNSRTATLPASCPSAS